jgi:hypothetical protein
METTPNRTESNQNVVATYNKRLDALYGKIKEWLEPLGFKCLEGAMELEQYLIGKYSSPTLAIMNAVSNEVVAKLHPGGALVIGAAGRIDIKGTADSDYLVYLLPASGVDVEVTTKIGQQPETKKTVASPVFRNVQNEDWYWTEIKKLARVRPLTKELFMDILIEVSPDEILSHT